MMRVAVRPVKVLCLLTFAAVIVFANAADGVIALSDTNREAAVCYDAPDRRPIYFGASSRCEGVGYEGDGNGSDYSVYLDVGYDDGTWDWARRVEFSRGTHDWETRRGVFLPPKPVKEIKAFLMFRKVSGTVWFREAFVVREAPPKGTVLVEARRTLRPYRDADVILQSVWNGTWAETRTIEALPSFPSANPLVADACAVWVADSMRKVTPLTFPLAADTAEARIDLDLLGRERESVQVCVSTGDARAMSGVDVRVGPLVSSSGAAFPGSVQLQRVGYLARPLQFHSHPLAIAAHETWFPEPLLPFMGLTVPKGATHGAWVTFAANADAKPDTYRGSLKVTECGRLVKEIPVSVRVWRRSLPATFGLRTAYCVMDGFTKASYPQDFAARRRESWDIMLDHRLNPDDISRTTLPDLELLEHAKRRGLNSFCALHLVPPPKDPNARWVCFAPPEDVFGEEFYQHLKSVLPPYLAELERRGLKDMAYLYGFDERGKEYYPGMLKMWERLKADFGLPVMHTSLQFRDVKEGRLAFGSPHAMMTDMFCPNESDYDPELADRYRASGKQVWWYTSCDPRYPYANNSNCEYPTVECRLLGWLSWQARVDGFLFWHVNAWWDATAKLDERQTYFPEWRVDNDLQTPGDGVFLYPGARGILPGIRLANVRDGVEDYEKLQLAERHLGRPKVESVVKRLVRSPTDFSRNPKGVRIILRALLDRVERK